MASSYIQWVNRIAASIRCKHEFDDADTRSLEMEELIEALETFKDTQNNR